MSDVAVHGLEGDGSFADDATTVASDHAAEGVHHAEGHPEAQDVGDGGAHLVGASLENDALETSVGDQVRGRGDRVEDKDGASKGGGAVEQQGGNEGGEQAAWGDGRREEEAVAAVEEAPALGGGRDWEGENVAADLHEGENWGTADEGGTARSQPLAHASSTDIAVNRAGGGEDGALPEDEGTCI